MKKILAIIALALSAVTAHSKNVNIVIPMAAGGQYDTAARVLEKYLADEVDAKDMTFTIVYRPGAGGQVGTNSVTSLPEGATEILVNGNNMLVAAIVNPLPNNLPLKKHLHVLGFVGSYPLTLVVPANSKFNTLNDLVEYCQTNSINYGTSGTGSTSHLFSATILSHFKCKSTQVPFKGTGPGLVALLGGHIDMFLLQDSAALAQTGKLKILATQKSALLPNTTVFPSDLKMSSPWAGIFMNSNAPAEDIKKIQAAFNRVLKNPKAVKELQERGWIDTGKELSNNWLSDEIENYTRISTNLGLVK